MPTIPKPTTSTASKARPEYDVLWNGVNDHRDGDLLNRVPEHPTTSHPLPPKSRDTTALVEAVLPTRERDAVTLLDLVRQTGMTAAAVTHALYQLRHRGRLQTLANRPRQWPARYWRSPAITNEQILVGGVGDWLRRE